MKHYLSPTGELYAYELDGSQDHLIPSDFKALTDVEVLALAPKPSLTDLKSAAVKNVRAMRVPVFATLAGIQSQALANANTATAKAISGLQDKLKALPETDLSKCATQADIDAAFVAAWMGIVAAAPANVASAFKGVLG